VLITNLLLQCSELERNGYTLEGRRLKGVTWLGFKKKALALVPMLGYWDVYQYSVWPTDA
jgi:hypothetical protein